jgi:DNA-binding NtrC family response regulator
MARNWPGNVRELESVLRAALLFAEGRRIDRKMLEGQGLGAKGPAPRAVSSNAEASADRSGLIELLTRHGFDKKKVAEELGLTLKTVYNLLEKAGLPTKKSLLMRAMQDG